MATASDLRDYISLVAGDITEEELSVTDFEKVIKKALTTYNAYIPDEKEFVITIDGSIISDSGGGYQFPAPYPRVVTATPQFIGINWWSDVSVASYTYDSSTGYLTIPSSGSYIVKYVQDITLSTVNEMDHPLFYKLLEAYFKVIVGGRRKRFRLTDYQIENDGDTMIEEGNNMLQEIREDLSDNMPFWLALVGR